MWKVKKTVNLPVMSVDAPQSLIQNEGDELAKQEIPECVKVVMFEIETEYIFWIRESYSEFNRVTDSSAKIPKVLESCIVYDPAVPEK